MRVYTHCGQRPCVVDTCCEQHVVHNVIMLYTIHTHCERHSRLHPLSPTTCTHKTWINSKHMFTTCVVTHVVNTHCEQHLFQLWITNIVEYIEFYRWRFLKTITVHVDTLSIQKVRNWFGMNQNMYTQDTHIDFYIITWMTLLIISQKILFIFKIIRNFINIIRIFGVLEFSKKGFIEM